MWRPSEAVEADLLCEELCARSDVLQDRYIWDEELDCAIRETAEGMRITLSGPLEGDQLHLEISWSALGTERYGALRTVPERVDRASSVLQKAGWQVAGTGRAQGTLRIEASLAIAGIAPRLGELARSLDQAISAMSFL